MTDPFARLRRFLRELKRRKVYRVAVTYAMVAAGAVQLVSVVIPASRLPAWSDELFLGLAVFGFPIAVVVAWAFEVTPEGVRRTEVVEGEGTDGSAYPWIGLALVVALAGGVWYMTAGGESQPSAETASVTDAPPSEPAVGERSIAVLPFENMGGQESEQFTEGVHDGLLTRLSNISDLKVISRTSVLQYENTDKTIPEIARELGAGWVVEGAVQQAAGQVQVNAQLIDAREDAHRWARNYQRELSPENLFALQSELTKQIARSLEAQLSPGEEKRVERRPTADLQAYQLYVQGRQQFAQRSRECLECIRQAAEFFRRAIDRDSTFALAWAGLADVATTVKKRVGFLRAVPDSLVPDPGVLPAPEAGARRALELDPDLAEAHASTGFIHLHNQNAPAALQELRRAVELKPSYWEAHAWLGDLYAFIDRPQKSLNHTQLAVELNPRHAPARHGLYDAYNMTGQPEKSLEEARLQQRMGLEQEPAVGGEVRALFRLGRFEEARRVAQEQVSKLGVETFWGAWFRYYLARILAAQGDTARAEKYLDELRAADGEHPATLGKAYAYLGQMDQALAIFQRIDEDELGKRGSGVKWMAKEFPSLRDDPRYRELARKENQSWGLNPDGSLPDSVDVSFGPDD